MHAPAPAELDDTTVGDAVAAGWGVAVRDLRYLSVGGGGYHWHLRDTDGGELFVTVDDLDAKDWLGEDRPTVARGLNESLATAWWLRDEASLAFVVAQLGALDGQPLVRLGDRYAISVTPFLEGHSYPFGPHTDAARRRRILDALIALHSVCPPAGIPNHARPRIGARADLEAFLREPGDAWHGGPYSEPARELLAPHAELLAARLEWFDDICRSSLWDRTVVTHGEPHAGNVMTVGEREVLIDWDTVGIATPERDLWFVVHDQADLNHYADATGHQPNTSALMLYKVRWQFDDLASIIKTLRGSHSGTDGTEHWLGALEPLIESILGAPDLRA